ncbi:MAG: HlyD family efflux transporter periplasmic adaptor subunit [Pseudomonadota bacterium]
MAINFSDTLASIHADLNQRSIFFSVMLGGLLLCWFGWLLWVPLTITKQASGLIEINQPTLLLVASAAGRIAAVNIHLGQLVKAGEPLIKINSDDEAKQISALTQSLEKQQEALVALHRARDVELNSLKLEISALDKRTQNARIQFDNVRAQYDQQAQMVKLLNSASSAVSKIELQREQLQLKQIHERLLTKQQELANLSAQSQQTIARKELLSTRNTQDNANQQSRISALESELSQQQQMLIHKTLSSPKIAKVAEVMPLQIGQWINAGEQLATLFPEGDLRVVAQFKPVDAQGYLQLGQSAKIHVDNFPWLQYGALDARVVQIDQAERHGFIRVVLALNDAKSLALQHGMSAGVSISVASATPWQLLLQSLGRRQLNL